ncbi:MAG: alpha/beta hydrolase-fold protein [Nonlabens sp.]
MAQELVIDSLLYNGTYRKIRTLLPSDYKSEARGLLFMTDAQNLFDPVTSYAGEWEVDESIARLPNQVQPIVISIDHGNSTRLEELTPYPHKKYGGGKAVQFLEFLLDEVSPLIRAKYDLPQPRSVAIAGSSLGGLFAHYAAITHPEYFDTAGIFSPSFWYSDLALDLTKTTTIAASQRYWLSAGDAESDTMVADMEKVYELLHQQQPNNVSMQVVNGAEHNERQWRSSFPEFLSYWLELEK